MLIVSTITKQKKRSGLYKQVLSHHLLNITAKDKLLLPETFWVKQYCRKLSFLSVISRKWSSLVQIKRKVQKIFKSIKNSLN